MDFRIVLLVVAGILVSIFFIETQQGNPTDGMATKSPSEVASEMVNTMRLANQQSTVTTNEALSLLAQEWALAVTFQKTSEMDSFVQSKSSVEGQDVIKSFLKDHGYDVKVFGVVWGFGSVQTVINIATVGGLTLTSTFSHTLLESKFTSIGAATGGLAGNEFSFVMLASDK